MANKPERIPGFYRVVVTEHGHPFETIGLYFDYGHCCTWLFAEGDGDEMGAGFNVISVNETIIAPDRAYVKQ